MDCIFCKIIRKEIPAKIVFKNANIVAFSDINPKARIHVLIVPKKHIPTFNDFRSSDGKLISEILLAAKKIAKKLKIDSSGYRLVLNCGSDAGQLVNHVHLHILGGEKLGAKRDF